MCEREGELPSYTMSHVICTSALIGLVFVMQVSFMQVADNMRTEMFKRELKEIADYVSDTLANLYFLADSTDSSNVTLQKTLSLPSDVGGSIFVVNITSSEDFAQATYACIKGNPRINTLSWISPSLKIGNQSQAVESGGKTVVAGCRQDVDLNVYVWITYG